MLFDKTRQILEEAEEQVKQALTRVTLEETSVTMEWAFNAVYVGSYKNWSAFRAFADPGATSGTIQLTPTAICPDGFRPINAKEFLVVAAKVGNIIRHARIQCDKFSLDMTTPVPTDQGYSPNQYPSYFYDNCEGHRLRLSAYQQDKESLKKECLGSYWLWVKDDAVEQTD